MSNIKILQNAVMEELKEDPSIKIPNILYVDTEFFKQLRSELYVTINGIRKKIPNTWDSFAVPLNGVIVEIRPDDYKHEVVH